jgi:transcription termination/antitermination factor NusG
MSDDKKKSDDVLPEKSSSTEYTEDNDRFKWYAVRIISGHEKKVKIYLDNEIKNEGMEDKIKEVIIPYEKVYEIKSGKKKIKNKNFLPGYIIVVADLDEAVKHFINSIPSILNMVGPKGTSAKVEPVALSPEEVARLKIKLNQDMNEQKVDFVLCEGDPVKVTSGPFNNFSGNVLEVNNDKMKVKVMVSIFGRKTPIELDLTEIEKEK